MYHFTTKAMFAEIFGWNERDCWRSTTRFGLIHDFNMFSTKVLLILSHKRSVTPHWGDEHITIRTLRINYFLYVWCFFIAITTSTNEFVFIEELTEPTAHVSLTLWYWLESDILCNANAIANRMCCNNFFYSFFVCVDFFPIRQGIEWIRCTSTYDWWHM